TGCEKPTFSTSASPCRLARYPTPTSSSCFSYPLLTPSIMFQTRVRVKPCSDRCSFDSLGRSPTTAPSLPETRICGFRLRLSSDLPLVTTTVWSETVTVTPLGLLPGRLPILLMGHQP